MLGEDDVKKQIFLRNYFEIISQQPSIWHHEILTFSYATVGKKTNK